jgi:hypothetical protein
MLSKFWPFKKKEPKIKPVKAVAVITHKSGEKISITIEGNTPELVAYIANKIKGNFDIKFSGLVKDNGELWKATDEVWKATDKVWDEFDKVFKK